MTQNRGYLGWKKTNNKLQTDWILIKDAEFQGDDIIARINKTDFIDDDSAEKAAKLIASAPKMLQILKENLNIFKEAKTVFDQAGLKMHADGTQLEIDKIEQFLKDLDL